MIFPVQDHGGVHKSMGLWLRFTGLETWLPTRPYPGGVGQGVRQETLAGERDPQVRVLRSVL